ncbi:FAD-dependent oxidoreductase [Rhodococcus sp. NPDC047139]|uniref:FAD-dependent oxidoreductase n=1 Tax=Rhodococcus sp. NPDC047139 TaxID=3155141 RepID=UPI0033DAE463
MNDFAALKESEIVAWDRQVDVIVVGCGAAGVSAAIEARTDGAEVLALEAAGESGGTSAMSGGLIYLGGGTALQKACGFEDSPEQMTRFLLAACGPHADEEKVRIYCEGSVAHYDWLVECGVPFKPSFWSAPTAEPWNDDGLMFSGGEDAAPFADLAKPAPRGHCPAAPTASRHGSAGGFLLMQVLARRAAELGVEQSNNTRVRRLVVDDHGAVVGVVARRFGQDMYLAARRGVVLAAGGFVHDDRLLSEHAPALVGTDKLGVEENDGSVLRAAMAVGAATVHMDAGEAAFSVPPALVKPGILVDAEGRRFINEDAYLGRVGQHGLFHRGGRVWLVLDEKIFDAAEEFRGPVQPDFVAETVEELAEEAGLPVSALVETVAAYNRAAEAGRDEQFGKAGRWLEPLRPPFAALDARGRFRTFTLGGLRTAPDGVVLDREGVPVPGLYAAGRITSGIPATGYVSGASLGDCTFFGRRAGASAALGRTGNSTAVEVGSCAIR